LGATPEANAFFDDAVVNEESFAELLKVQV
jgi:hypothetical protein